MGYSGATIAKSSRESLGEALGALQKDADLPADVLAVAENIAKAVGALFEAERSSTEPDGKTCVRNALGSLSQTLALLQEVSGNHAGVRLATEVIAKSMSHLYPLTTAVSRPPSLAPTPPTRVSQPAVAPQSSARPVPAPPSTGPRPAVEANIGATTVSNFFVGFSGEISEGGVFLATYDTFPVGTAVTALITLPGGFEIRSPGHVRFVRDPMDFTADSEPGMGIAFEALDPQGRELVLRFIRKRAPMFYDE